MSVAFRRDSDEEHLEPRFERPVPPGPNPVTARGLALLQARVDGLEAMARLSPDGMAGTEAARDLRYWRRRLATAEPAPPAVGDVVAFGTRVRFRLNGQVREAALVGHDEAAETADTLAVSAPLARAMLGAEAGDTLAFGGREDAIEVLAVAPAAA